MKKENQVVSMDKIMGNIPKEVLDKFPSNKQRIGAVAWYLKEGFEGHRTLMKEGTKVVDREHSVYENSLVEKAEDMLSTQEKWRENLAKDDNAELPEGDFERNLQNTEYFASGMQSVSESRIYLSTAQYEEGAKVIRELVDSLEQKNLPLDYNGGKAFSGNDQLSTMIAEEGIDGDIAKVHRALNFLAEMQKEGAKLGERYRTLAYEPTKGLLDDNLSNARESLEKIKELRKNGSNPKEIINLVGDITKNCTENNAAGQSWNFMVKGNYDDFLVAFATLPEARDAYQQLEQTKTEAQPKQITE